MIKSMTGYGKAILEKNSRTYQVEIKSVNHRYLDITVKLPRNLSYLEEEIKKIVSKSIKRGKIDIYINYENSDINKKDITLNLDIAKAYIRELKKLASEENIESNIDIVEISKFPDVLEVENINEDEEIIRLEVNSVMQNVIENILVMKKLEGEEIVKDLKSRILVIKAKILEITNISTRLIDEYVVKLEKRIKEITRTAEIEQSRLAQEVVIYADKSSIEEEIIRLNSHISQFEKLLDTNEQIGKKLDFIIQEMNRETNTIGSKANNLVVTNNVIDIKAELENIREQIQNVE